jgi:hypothetical protein
MMPIPFDQFPLFARFAPDEATARRELPHSMRMPVAAGMAAETRAWLENSS